MNFIALRMRGEILTAIISWQIHITNLLIIDLLLFSFKVTKDLSRNIWVTRMKLDEATKPLL